jgi:hypothetical protein
VPLLLAFLVATLLQSRTTGIVGQAKSGLTAFLLLRSCY